MGKTAQLPKGTITHLQKYIADKIVERGFEDETVRERLVLLMEEVGELAKACRKVSGMNQDQVRENSYHVGEELTDVINMVFAVGIELGLNIEQEFLKKEAEVDKRLYARGKHKAS
jgi:NTP pyrophosphatase (non-canonical NTP hydrolase)